MRKIFIALILILLSNNVKADQIDYFCLFSNQAAAQADSTIGSYWNGSSWRGDVAFPGLSVVSSQAIVNSISSLTGFWIVISSVNQTPSLDASPNCYMTINRDKVIILSTALSASGHQTFQFSPVPFGSHYPRPLGQ